MSSKTTSICSESNDLPMFAKTRMCLNYKNCKYGKNCHYAHTEDELVDFDNTKHPRYRTSLCYYGDECKNPKCGYAHSEKELRTCQTIGNGYPKDTKFRTVMCRYGNSCLSKECTYAHNVTELRDSNDNNTKERELVKKSPHVNTSRDYRIALLNGDSKNSKNKMTEPVAVSNGASSENSNASGVRSMYLDFLTQQLSKEETALNELLMSVENVRKKTGQLKNERETIAKMLSSQNALNVHRSSRNGSV